MPRELRVAVVVVTLLIACAVQHVVSSAGGMQRRPVLHTLPLRLGPWRGSEDVLPDEIVAALHPDEYVFRRYAVPGRTPLTLYIAYYGRERLDERVHSPSACLPAGGWLPVSVGRQVVTLSGPPYRIEVNRYLVERGAERQGVLYWFQGRGRIVADDVKATFYLGLDALAGRGREETLIRINAPVEASPENTIGEESDFVSLLQPSLARLLAHP